MFLCDFLFGDNSMRFYRDDIWQADFRIATRGAYKREALRIE